MAGYIEPIPATSGGDPEVLPWATSGTTLEPNTSQEATGWQAYGVGPPPDYRLENYARLVESLHNRRSIQAALQTEYAWAEIQIAGVAVGVNQRRVTVNGVNFDYTDQAGDTTATIAAAFCALVNADAVINLVVRAVQDTTVTSIFYIIGTTPGRSITVATAVLAGAGTITLLSAATTPIVRAEGGTYSATQLDHVIGSTQCDDSGNVAEDDRIVWRKAKGSLRAGRFQGTEADDANTGDASTAFGLNPTASGTESHAVGTSAAASNTHAQARGHSATASGLDSHATGSAATASAANTHAYGSAAVASGASSWAGGLAATAGAAGSVALGPGAVTAAGATSCVALGGGSVGAAGITATAIHGSATGANAVAIALGSSATGTDSAAIGGTATASNTRALATGSATASAVDASAHGTGTASGTASHAHGPSVSATAEAARASGYATGGGTIVASGIGARAHGDASTGNVLAGGNGAQAYGVATNGADITAPGAGASASGACDVLGTGGISAAGRVSRAHGEGVSAGHDYASARGWQAATLNRGEHARAASAPVNGVGGPQQGYAQNGEIHAYIRTTDAAATVMLPGAGASTWTLKTDCVYEADIRVTAWDEATGNRASWHARVQVAAPGGVAAIDYQTWFDGAGGVAPVVGVFSGNAAPQFRVATVGLGAGASVALAAPGGAVIDIAVTGIAATNIRWSARVDWTQVGGAP